jgi:hypothetical protein
MYGFMLCVVPGYRWLPNEVTSGPYGNDFLQEWVGGRMILDRNAKQLYDWKSFDAAQHDPANVGFSWNRETFFPPVYPPPHYLAATSLAWLPYRLSVCGWHMVLVISLITGIAITVRTIATDQLDSSPDRLRSFVERWSWLSFALFPPLFYSFAMGQKGPFWFLLLAGTWGLLRQRQNFLAGLIFGCVSIKPTLFFLLPIVMLRYRQWRFLSGLVVTASMLWIGSWLILPSEVWTGFAAQFGLAKDYASIQGYHLDWSCNLIALSTSSAPSVAIIAKYLVVLPLVIYTLWLVLREPVLDWHDPGVLFRILIATFLLSPHAYYYDLAVLLIPIMAWFVVQPIRGVAYLTVVTAAILAASDCLSLVKVPIIPIVFVGLLTEQWLAALRMRQVKIIAPSCQ